MRKPNFIPLLLLSLIALGNILIRQPAACGSDLEYRFQNDGQYDYSFDIEATVGSEVQRIKGTSTYRASSAGAEVIEEDSSSGTGTGFVVHSDGYLVTCEHVVEGASRIEVKIGKKTYLAKVIITDEKRDLAIIQIEAKGLSTVPLGDSEKVELAQQVRVIGYPLASVLGSSIKVTQGAVAGVVDQPEGKLLQVDAAINPGNSGGPLVDSRGTVIGIASAKLAGVEISSVGFAVPVNAARRLLEGRGIKFQTGGAKKPLSGPEVVKRVTPAVALISVTKGGGGGTSRPRYRLSFHGTHEVWLRPQGAGHAANCVQKQDKRSGTIVVNNLGKTSDITGIPTLPFALGSQGTVGIERLADGDQKVWTSEALTVVTHLVPETKSSRNIATPGRIGIAYPALERTRYEIIDGAPAGMIKIHKKYELKTMHKPGERPMAHFTGEGTFLFNEQVGLVDNMRFSGTLSVSIPRPMEIPVKYSYKRVGSRAIPDSVASVSRPKPSPGTSGRTLRPRRKPSVNRLKVPTGQARKKGEASVNSVFGKEIENAKTSARKLAMAEKVFKFAMEDNDTTQRFVLLNKARSLAADAGDLPMAMKVVGELVTGYEIDVKQAELATLGAVVKRASSTEQHAAVAQLAAELMEEAIVKDNMAIVPKLGAIALESARKGHDSQLAKQVVKRGREFQTMNRVFQQVKPYQEILAKNPDNPDANLMMGKYYCLIKRDWDTGLPMLAKSSDSLLKTAAAKELAKPGSTSEKLALADEWWSLADQHQGDASTAMRARAFKWYKEVEPSLAGLKRATVEKHFNDYPELAGRSKTGSSRTSDRIVASKPASPSRTKTSSKAGGAKGLLQHVGLAVQENRTMRTDELGFKLGKQAFTAVPKDGGIMVGLDLSIGTFNKITAVRPIFATAKGQINGPIIGAATSKTTRLIARRGYAVGAMTIKGGIGIDGLGITFMKIAENGLNTKDSYNTGWFGSAGGQVQLGGDGSPVVGLFGHYDSRRISSIGLVTVEEKQ